jgi:hypothetical protein
VVIETRRAEWTSRQTAVFAWNFSKGGFVDFEFLKFPFTADEDVTWEDDETLNTTDWTSAEIDAVLLFSLTSPFTNTLQTEDVAAILQNTEFPIPTDWLLGANFASDRCITRTR